jgi:hypothetical protein
MTLEIHDAIVSTTGLFVNNTRDRKKGHWSTAAGATEKTVLFHYNRVGAGLMSEGGKDAGIVRGVPARQSYQVVL